MAAIQVHYSRVDHDDYAPVDPDVSILQLCRCGCGAVRDARGVADPEPFGVWAMTHEPPAHGSYLCATCGTLALPTNSNLVDGQRFVHRACQDQPKPARTHSFFCADDGCRGECQSEPERDL